MVLFMYHIRVMSMIQLQILYYYVLAFHPNARGRVMFEPLFVGAQCKNTDGRW